MKKNILERLRMYKININKKQKDENSKTKNNKINISKKNSKIKIFFKMILGFIAGFFEYLVIKSNQKNFTKANNKKVGEINNKELTETNQKSVDKQNNNESNLNHNKKMEVPNINNENKISKISIKTTKIPQQTAIIKNKSKNYNDKKNNLTQIENQIIFANNLDELNYHKLKILNIKKELETNKEKLQNNNSEHTLKKSIGMNQPSKEKVEKDKLIVRCDQDLILIEQKKKYINSEIEYRKEMDKINLDKEEFKFTQNDLNQIKNNVNSILKEQTKELGKLKKYFNKSINSNNKIPFLTKIKMFFNHSVKLSFSFIPFVAFPSKLIGLTTSTILVNNSLKQFKKNTNSTDMNQLIDQMLISKENCLKIGINTCQDSLNEIENIKLYLNNLPSNLKETFEYRKYLLDVISTSNQIQNQISCLNKISKNYFDYKVKVKKIGY